MLSSFGEATITGSSTQATIESILIECSRSYVGFNSSSLVTDLEHGVVPTSHDTENMETPCEIGK